MNRPDNDSEEAKNAKFNIEVARNADVTTIDSTGNDYTERDKIRDCVTDK